MRKPVLTIFYQFNPWQSSVGGIQTIIRSFIKYAPETFDIRLVGTGDRTAAIGKWQIAELDGRSLQFMPVLAIDEDNSRKRVPTTLRYLAALLGRDLASDFMHFHRLEPTLAARSWTGQKTLFIHNDLRQQVASKQKKSAILWQKFPGLYFALERSLVSQFDQIFSCNTESAKFYQQQYPTIANRVSYLKNTVDTAVFYPLSPMQRAEARCGLAYQLNLSIDTQFILFAGRLHPQKDPLLLVHAFAALQAKQTHLLIAGAGELATELQAEINQLHLVDRVTLLGPLPQSRLAELQRLSSVFVLTSLYEGLPVSVLESLACGVPIVTTRCGETPNLLLPGSGLVCEERTPSAVADALRQVLNHPEAYPAEVCVKAAAPYAARSVVQTVFDDMLDRWHHSLVHPSAQ